MENIFLSRNKEHELIMSCIYSALTYSEMGEEFSLENIMADILGKMERKLYYYHKDGGVELDFLMRYRGKCTPVECKATTGNAKSLRSVLNNYDKYHVSNAIKLGDYNVGRKDHLLTMPMYMAFLLTEV